MQNLIAEVPSLTAFGAISGIVITALTLGASRSFARSWLAKMTNRALVAIIIVALAFCCSGIALRIS